VRDRAEPSWPAGDELLVHRALDGDRAAFAMLFDRHRPMATSLVARLLGERDQVDDVLQEAAIQALVGLDRLRDPSRFGSWLSGIALNLARQTLRQRLRQVQEPTTGDPQLGLTEELAEEQDAAARVREAVELLPAGQREAVRLFYLESLTEAEVAAELGIARSAVKSRLHKARRSLQRRLRKSEEVTTMPTSSLLEVDVIDVRREAAAPRGLANHVVVLRERGGNRILPIFIGEPEGRAMAASLTGVENPRPMTYQLATNLIGALSGSVAEVRVVRLAETTYIAEVVLNGPAGPAIVDARPSDAINLALITAAPVRVGVDVMGQFATTPEPFNPEEYTDGAQDIRAEIEALREPESPERLDAETLAVLDGARRAAAGRGHPAVGTEHVLFALLERSTPERLALIGMTVAQVESALEQTEPRPFRDRPRLQAASAAPPLTPRMYWVLVRAWRRAEARSEYKARPDDVLVALLEEPGGEAARLMSEVSVDREALRASLA
jgi:RNA polymerase sigma factor (sigma-70 family)